jgi:Protein of unknown function (DUF2911)
MIKLNWVVVLLSLASSLAIDLYAQDAVISRPSPLAIVSARYKDTYIKITYSQPHQRKREIFGALVPYDQIWRTGANEATEITFTKDIFVNSQLVIAGTYSLFTIPRKEKWVIILNKDVGLWGSYNYNQKMDVIRFEIQPQILINMTYEPFTILLDQKNNKAEISLIWDTTKVTFPIDFIEPKS